MRSSRAEGAPDDRHAFLEQAIEAAAHLLPAQGPIRVFIHHNTLHAFEDLHFDSAVQKGARIFGCQPYLPEERYREKLARGRIRTADLEAVLREDLGARGREPILHLDNRLDLRLAMLLYPLRLAPTPELRWFVARTDALKTFRDAAPPLVREAFVEETRQWVLRDWSAEGRHDSPATQVRSRLQLRKELKALRDQVSPAALDSWSKEQWEAFTLQLLWTICRNGVRGVKGAVAPPVSAIRPRDLLLAATGQDSDALVNELLIRFCAAFLDQGFTRWPLPGRERGFLHSFCMLYRQRGGPPDRWLHGLGEMLARLQDANTSPTDSILESLQLLGIPEAEWDVFLSATLLALRGWAGMIHQMETRGDRTAQPAPAGSLVEFLAVRLILDRLALAYIARTALGYLGPLAELRQAASDGLHKQDGLGVEQRAFLVFHLAQIRGWLPGDLIRLTGREWSTLVGEIEAFPGLERRRVLQQAFERRFRVQTLDALSFHCRCPEARTVRPSAQVICCIDEREESFRRHLEELAPDIETFGVAGFFNVAMYYRGTTDAHFVPLCPVVIKPHHWVAESVAPGLDETHQRQARVRRVLGALFQQIHFGSRTFLGGALLAAFGAAASVPLVARVLVPRWTAHVRRSAGRLFQMPTSTVLRLERSSGTESRPDECGFTLPEMADIVGRVLGDSGMQMKLARLVIIVGHGSYCLNNPHESAYNCGACGGAVGGPNARALAQMANDPRVRALLADRGVLLPAETVFVGALHNTCDDSLTFYDRACVPASHQQEFEQIRSLLDAACQRNAHERCRRFLTAPLDMSSAAARRHVEARAQDLAETRPECGHATNAICFVGRRQRTRGLYMDRRAFLVSYDSTEDDSQFSVLTRLLQAAVPVCAGINLEYYFSYVDPTGWGCGTKLPHNVTSLLGVMDGAASDLRPGLPWQMVELHEPMRLLFVIENTPQALLDIMAQQPDLGRLCRNEWVQLAVLDPVSSAIQVFHNGRFEPYKPSSRELPRAASSQEWYGGRRDHCGFAQIVPATRQEPSRG